MYLTPSAPHDTVESEAGSSTKSYLQAKARVRTAAAVSGAKGGGRAARDEQAGCKGLRLREEGGWGCAGLGLGLGGRVGAPPARVHRAKSF
jgi:hypothetical protein